METFHSHRGIAKSRATIPKIAPPSRQPWPRLFGLFVVVACLTALIDALGTSTLVAIDTRLAGSIEGWRGGSHDGLMLNLTHFGGWGMTAIAVFSMLGLWVSKRRRESFLLLLVSGGAMLLNLLLKFAIDRPRPGVDLIYLISDTRFASFPSGHTMGAVTTLGSLMIVAHRLGAPIWARWLGWSVCGLVIAGIGLSRIYLGAHFPSDVLGGLLASIAWLVFITGSLEGFFATDGRGLNGRGLQERGLNGRGLQERGLNGREL